MCGFCSVFSNYSYHRHLSDINIPWLILTNISQIFPHLEEEVEALHDINFKCIMHRDETYQQEYEIWLWFYRKLNLISAFFYEKARY